jgi:hypothetical protein
MSGSTAPSATVTPASSASKDIVSKRKDSRYRSGRCDDWLKSKNPHSAAVKREAEEDAVMSAGLVAVCRAAQVAVVAARPHPGTALRPDSREEENAADDHAVFEHVEVFEVRPDGRAFENESGHHRVASASAPCAPRRHGLVATASAESSLPLWGARLGNLLLPDEDRGQPD